MNRDAGDTRHDGTDGYCHRFAFAATSVLLAFKLTVAARDELAAKPSQHGSIWQSYAAINYR